MLKNDRHFIGILRYQAVRDFDPEIDPFPDLFPSPEVAKLDVMSGPTSKVDLN